MTSDPIPGRSAGLRAAWAVLALALAVPAVRFLAGDAAPRPKRPDVGRLQRLPADRLAAAPSVLLALTERPARNLALDGPWMRVDDVEAASPRRDPALASLLTGRPVLAHRVLFDGDAQEGGPRDPTLAERLGHAGYEVRAFGVDGLPGWAARGAARAPGGLAEAAAWVGDRAGPPRCAIAWMGSMRFDDVDLAALERVGEPSLVGLASVLGRPVEAQDGRFIDAESVAVDVALCARGVVLPYPAPGPHSACEVASTLLAAAGLLPVGPTLMDGRDPLVVAFAHGADGRPHRIRARTPGQVLDVQVTPLGGHPTDDWELLGAAAEHVAYRNAARRTPPGDAGPLLERLAAWRERNERREWRPPGR